MSDQRFIIEMGMGNDLYGMDYTKAAIRAVQDALHHSAMPLFDALAIAPEAMRVDVTIAVQEPDALDTAAVKACVPWGTVSVQAVPGGLNVTDPRTGRTIVIATAAVQAFLAPQEGWRLV